MAQASPRAAQPAKGGSAAPRRKGKATYDSTAHSKHTKEVYKVKNEVQKPKETIWATPNRYSYQSKAQASRSSLQSCFELKNNSKGEVIAKHIGHGKNIYINAFIWVPKTLVTNMQGPKNLWGPKSRN